MANTDLAVRIATILDSTGLKKADKAFDKFEKKTKNLGKVLGVTLGAAAFGAYTRNAIKAFAADERAAVQLSQALKNLGLGFQDALAGQFVADLEKSASVADDQLRPALQSLLTTTGSLAKSQELLNLAIETSRGSGIDLLTTTNDIAQAYVGNTKGLKKYYLGLTQVELKTASFATVQAKLNEQFKGSNAAYLDTTAGKFEAISVAAGNAAEVIGGSLVDSLITLTGSNDVGGLNYYIEAWSIGFDKLLKGATKFAWSIGWILSPKNWGKPADSWLKEYEKMLSDRAYSLANNFDPNNNAVTGYKTDEAAKKKAIADAAKREKEMAALAKKQAAAQKALTAEQKKQAALKKAASIFDMEQIQIIAALKGNISADERKRLELQLAIATGNVDEAKKLTYELAISQGMTVKLAQSLASMPAASNPFAAWKGYLDEIELQAKRIAGFKGGSSGGGSDTGNGAAPLGGLAAGVIAGVNLVPTNVVSLPSPNASVGNRGLGWDPASITGANINVTVTMDGKVVAESLQNQSLNGNNTTVNRTLGNFR